MSAKDYSLFNYKDQSIFGLNSENHLMDSQNSNHAYNLFPRPDITQQTIKSMQNWELKECGYCKAIGLDYHGHTKFECRRLAALAPCNICGASGFNNHTAS
uniref:Nanos-type domain-containing protein n=1 Tax=Acrobeloides nanus TaxID=290746 RepID=A0A914D374_9BILA